MKKLIKYQEIIKKIKGDLDELKSYGFKVKHVSGVTGYIYINKKVGVVIKQCYLTTPLRLKPTIAIETVVVRGYGDPILIQPLATVTPGARRKAYKLLQTKMSYADYIKLYDVFDLHDGNTAIYNRKAVMIDW